MSTNTSFTKSSQKASTMGGLSRIHMQSQFNPVPPKTNPNSGMGGLSQMQLDSHFNPPTREAKANSGMGGLSQMRLESQFNPPSRQTKTNSGMGGLSKIGYSSNLHSTTKNSKTLPNRNKGGNSQNQSYHLSEIREQMHQTSGMGGMSRMHVESLIRQNNPTTPKTSKTDASDNSGSIRTTLSKTISNEAFKQAEIKITNDRGFHSEMRSNSK